MLICRCSLYAYSYCSSCIFLKNNLHGKGTQLVTGVTLVSLEGHFLHVTQRSFGGALCDIQKTAARETRVTHSVSARSNNNDNNIKIEDVYTQAISRALSFYLVAVNLSIQSTVQFSEMG